MWPAANPTDPAQLREHLIRTYGRTPRAVVALDNACRADWTDAGEPSWIVRVASKHRPFASVSADVALLEHLAGEALPVERCAAEPSVSAMGERAVVVTVCERGAEAEDASSTWARLGDLAGRLAALPVPPADVSVARDVGAYPNQTPRLSLGDELDHVTSCLRAVEGEVPAAWAPLYESMRAYLEAPLDFDDLPRGLIHPDLAPPNAFDTPDRGLVLVDWAGAGVGPRVVTLAVLLAYSTLGEGGWSASRGADIVSSFTDHVVLEASERRAVVALAERRLFVREAVGLCIGIRVGVPPLSRSQWSGASAAVREMGEVIAAAS